MAKKEKVFSAAQLKEMTSDYPENVSLASLLGKTIKIISARKVVNGEYGPFYSVTLGNGTGFATSSKALVQVIEGAIEENMFPFTGVILQTKAKKKGQKGYYYFED